MLYGRGFLGKKGVDEKLIIDTQKKYTDFNICDTIFSNELIVSSLVNGCFDKKAFADWLDQHSYFNNKSEELPPWKVIMDFYNWNDADIKNAIKKCKNNLMNA